MAFLIPHNARDPETAPALARILPLWGTPPGLRRGSQPIPFCSGPQWQLSCQETFAPLAAHLSEKRGQLLLALSEMRDDQGNGILMPLDSDWLLAQPCLGPKAPTCLERPWQSCGSNTSPACLPPSIFRAWRKMPVLLRLPAAVFAKTASFTCITNPCSAWPPGRRTGRIFFSRSAHHRAKIRRAWRKARSEGRHGIPNASIPKIQPWRCSFTSACWPWRKEAGRA